jgi:hypothetical protein
MTETGRDTGSTELQPAYYAQPRFLSRKGVRDWWTLLHPPYTLWHLAYVVIGACLVGPVHVARLVASVIAFFLAVGIAAHALDELHGRPLRTSIPDWALVVAAVGGLAGAVVIGIVGALQVGWLLAIFIVVGVALALSYNLELFGARLHTDAMFAASWGTFPVLTGYAAQHDTVGVPALCAGVFAYFLASAQRRLSTPARRLRRRTTSVSGTVVAIDGSESELTATSILDPLEGALASLSWSVVALAVALALAQLHPWR